MLSFRFYLISDRLHGLHDPVALLPELIDAGLRAMQVREKDLSPAELDDFCRNLLAAVARNGHGAPRFFLNDRADIALSLGFAGVHLRQDSLPLYRQAPWLRNALMWGVSTHTLEGVLGAEAAEADFVTFGPVFPTPSHPEAEGVGLDGLAEVAAHTHLPVFALGGVTPERVPACLEAGAHGVAAISPIWRAEDPLAVLAAYREALGGHL